MPVKRLFFLSLFISAFCAFSQKNISKINLSDALLKMYSFSQERACSKRLSVQLSLKAMPQTNMAGAKFTEHFYPESSRNPFLNTKTSAMAGALELRIYGKEKPAMEGFYWGPYLSLASFKANTGTFNAEFAEAKSGTVYPVQLQQNYQMTMTTGGIQVGMQKQIGKGFRIDWTILGLGLSNINFQGKIDLVNTSENVDLRNFSMDSRDAQLKLENYFPLQKNVEAHRISLSNTSWAPMVKMGVAIGFGY